MPTPVGQWRYSSVEELLRLVDLLSRTRGVLSVNILKGRVVFTHQPWAQVDLLESPNEPASWREKLSQIDLRHYNVNSLLEGVVFGWEQMRQIGRYATHIVAWNRAKFFDEMFPSASWPHDGAFFDELYGMRVVDLHQEGTADGDVLPGTVVLCGGRLMDGDVEAIDVGLLIRRGKV